jgi:ABC-type multidrug transport system ATPase subunit
MAMARLGKDVVDLLDATVVYPPKTVLRDIEWRIAPGERTGILGVNGAGKSTLLGLIAGTVTPTSGRVKRGKTVKIATLTQLLGDLDDILDERVSAVIAGKRTTYLAGGKEMTPGQMLERLGFTSTQLSTPVRDLSGGQKRRLQLLLILLDEPNVLILDEPTNDLDTDMLAAMEDLLDSWPGTLIVVSHDRYLIERITDNQYAVMDAALRHLPGGVDQYLTLRRSESAASKAAATSASGSAPPVRPPSATPALAGADLRNAQKEVASIDRKLAKLADRVALTHERLAEHDQSDYEGLGVITSELRGLEDEVADLETRWLELSEQLEH